MVVQALDPDMLQFAVAPDEVLAAPAPAITLPDDLGIMYGGDSKIFARRMLEAVMDQKTARSLVSLIDLMGVAEEEIDQAMRRTPRKATEIYNSFGLVGKGPSLNKFNDQYPHLFRGHCRELIGRVVSGGDTRLGTMGEMLMAMAEASQVAVMKSLFNWAYFETFVRFFNGVMGLQHETVDLAIEMVESYRHLDGYEKDQIIEYVAMKLTVPERVLRSPLKPIPEHRQQ